MKRQRVHTLKHTPALTWMHTAGPNSLLIRMRSADPLGGSGCMGVVSPWADQSTDRALRVSPRCGDTGGSTPSPGPSGPL